MKNMTPKQWKMHIDTINDFHEDAFQQDIIWVNNITTLSKHGEDNNIKSRTINLKGLVYYNVFRSWPIDQGTDSGDLDKQSCMIYLNKKWLEENGYLNNDGEFAFNPDHDRFIIKGNKYFPSGDSDVAQAYDNPLLVFIILKRDQIPTGKIKYPKT